MTRDGHDFDLENQIIILKIQIMIFILNHFDLNYFYFK